MRFAEFESAARALWDEIPDEYKQGVDGLVVDRASATHPEHPDVYTLGECVTEDYPSQYGGPDTIRSAVVLYYGSFRALARTDHGFDWRGEIHETLMHELQHHLESLATEDTLEDFDYAVDENFKRVQGAAFDPLFYRAGMPLESGVYAVESDIFFEIVTADPAPLSFRFEWEAVQYRVMLPASGADVSYVYIENAPDAEHGDLCVVRVMKRGALATLRAVMRGGTSVEETSARAEVLA
ncbi:MAG: metallopeptidase family protein [Gemmatimonadota bacterium]